MVSGRSEADGVLRKAAVRACGYEYYTMYILRVQGHNTVCVHTSTYYLPRQGTYLRTWSICGACLCVISTVYTYGRYRTLCCGTCLIALVHNAVLWSLFHVQVLHIKVCQCLPQQVTSCSASCLIFPVHLRRFHVKGVREPKVL